jgi:hypothetical protein
MKLRICAWCVAVVVKDHISSYIFLVFPQKFGRRVDYLGCPALCLFFFINTAGSNNSIFTRKNPILSKFEIAYSLKNYRRILIQSLGT